MEHHHLKVQSMNIFKCCKVEAFEENFILSKSSVTEAKKEGIFKGEIEIKHELIK